MDELRDRASRLGLPSTLVERVLEARGPDGLAEALELAECGVQARVLALALQSDCPFSELLPPLPPPEI